MWYITVYTKTETFQMYAKIVDRKLVKCDGVPTLEEVQKIVGGWIERAFEVESVTRPTRHVDVYVNEEGLLDSEMPIDHIRIDNGSPLAGPIVIVGSDGADWCDLNDHDLREALSYIGRLPYTAKPSDFGF